MLLHHSIKLFFVKLYTNIIYAGDDDANNVDRGLLEQVGKRAGLYAAT